MLKGISPLLSPELLKVLAEMGHGDELVIGDANFAAQSLGQRVVRCDGLGGVELLDAVLSLLPLDTFVETPVNLMQVVPGTLAGDPPIWQEFAARCKSTSRASSLGRWNGSRFTTGRARRLPAWRRASARCTRASSLKKACCNVCKALCSAVFGTVIRIRVRPGRGASSPSRSLGHHNGYIYTHVIPLSPTQRTAD